MCSWVGFQQPATEAEFTFLLTGSSRVDTYDITNVNGFSMPYPWETNVASPSGYQCGVAGNNVACWRFKCVYIHQYTPHY